MTEQAKTALTGERYDETFTEALNHPAIRAVLRRNKVRARVEPDGSVSATGPSELAADAMVQLLALAANTLAEHAQLRADLERAREERDAARAELARAVLAEREACCAILASAEPNTRAEQAIARIDADPRRNRLPSWLDRALAEWCAATADELRDLRQQIQARGVDDAIRDVLNAPLADPDRARDRHFDEDGSTLAAPPPAPRAERGGEP
jgi:hypothetical protein